MTNVKKDPLKRIKQISDTYDESMFIIDSSEESYDQNFGNAVVKSDIADKDLTDLRRDSKEIFTKSRSTLIYHDIYEVDVMKDFLFTRDFKLSAPAAVMMNDEYKVTLLFNPFATSRICNNYKEVAAVLEHETLHILNKHLYLARYIYKDIEPMMLNIAFDTEINQMVKLPLPDNHVDLDFFNKFFKTNALPNKNAPYYVREMLASSVYKQRQEDMQNIKEQLEKMSSEELEQICKKCADGDYYGGEILKKSIQENNYDQWKDVDHLDSDGKSERDIDSPNKKSGGSGNGSEETESSDESDKTGGSNFNEKSYSEEEMRKSLNDIAEKAKKQIRIKKNEESQKESYRQKIRELRSQESRSSHGSGNSKEIYTVKSIPSRIKWEAYLKHRVGKVKRSYRHTHKILSRHQPYNPRMSGKLPNREIGVVMIVDTSGSIGQYDMNKYLNEVMAISKIYNLKRLVLIQADTMVQDVSYLDVSRFKNNQLQIDIKGMGGTTFAPAVCYAMEKDFFKDNIVIYFTDGYGDRATEFHRMIDEYLQDNHKSLSPKVNENLVWAISGSDERVRKYNLGTIVYID